MAERRMFAKTIIDSDVFLDMPMSSQALYFHLAMRADDDGFINNPKRVMKTVGANQNDLDILGGKRYILGFESGVIVIKHWKIHNYIQKDRYKPTLYIEEKDMITTKDNKSYTDMYPECVHDVRVGKVRLGKVSQDKGSEEKPKRFQPPTVEEVKEYAESKGYTGFNAVKFQAHYESNGWMVGRNKMKSWKAAITNWQSSEYNSTQTPHSAGPTYAKLAVCRNKCTVCGKQADLRYGKCEECADED